MRPLVRLKIAASLDGRITSASGISRWITGPEIRRHVHAMRASSDGIVVGIGTALADDPSLTVRDVARPERTPLRIVLDSSARLPLDAQLVRTAHVDPTLIVTSLDADTLALEEQGVRVLRVPQGPGGLDLHATLDALGALGLTQLLVEGGARLAGRLIEQDLVDELHWMIAPIALGDRGAASLIGLAPSSPDQAPRFRLNRLDRVGDDAWLVLGK